MSDTWLGEKSEDVQEERDGCWEGDTGTLDFDARRALLQLLRGPSLVSDKHTELWQALLNHKAAISSRLADLFLELVVDEAAGTAFVRNAPADNPNAPKTVRNQPLTIIDTIMVLLLRRELLTCGFERALIGRGELFDQMAQYRPLAKLDESAYLKKLEASWAKLDNAGILQKTDAEDRYEISPVLKLIFGADEVRAVNEEFDRLLAEVDEGCLLVEPGNGEADEEE